MKTNNQWYRYNDHGTSYFKLEDDVLLQATDRDEQGNVTEYCEVDWERGVENEADRQHLLTIVEDLKTKD